MLADLPVLDAEEADRAPDCVLSARRELDELPGVRPFAVDERGDVVALADHLVDRELHVRKAGAEHPEDRLDALETGWRARRRDVVDVVGMEELVDDVEVPLVDDLLDHATVDVLVRLDVGRPILAWSARVAVLGLVRAGLGHLGPGRDAELLHHRQHVELPPALADEAVTKREDVDAPDAHAPPLRGEAEQLARLPPRDHPQVGGPVALDHDELRGVVEVGDRRPEVGRRLGQRRGACAPHVEEAGRRVVVEIG